MDQSDPDFSAAMPPDPDDLGRLPLPTIPQPSQERNAALDDIEAAHPYDDEGEEPS